MDGDEGCNMLETRVEADSRNAIWMTDEIDENDENDENDEIDEIDET